VQNDKPLVSVAMNCYNGERYLRDALDSVLSQTYKNWELIFWDNQSTDRSAEIFKSYNERRFKYFYAQRHTILYEARNYAIEKAQGKFIAFLDVDDWWEKQKLEKQLPLFDDPDVGIVCGNFWFVDERKRSKKEWIKGPVPTGRVLNDLLANRRFVGLLTLMVRRSAIEQFEYPCNPRYHLMGDFDLVIRLAVKWKFDFVSQPVAFYRWHGRNESIICSKDQLGELETWYSEMKDHSVISIQPGFRIILDRINYLKGMLMVSERNRFEAYSLWQSLQWGQLKAKLFFALFCPLPLLKLLRQ